MLGGNQVGGDRSRFPGGYASTENASHYREENCCNHRESSQRDACGNGETTKLLTRILHERIDVFLCRGDGMVKFEVERRVSGLHGRQVLNHCFRVLGFPKEESIYIFFPSSVHVEFLKSKVGLADVDGLIRAGVREGELKSLASSEIVESPALKVLAGKEARLGGLIKRVM